MCSLSRREQGNRFPTLLASSNLSRMRCEIEGMSLMSWSDRHSTKTLSLLTFHSTTLWNFSFLTEKSTSSSITLNQFDTNYRIAAENFFSSEKFLLFNKIYIQHQKSSALVWKNITGLTRKLTHIKLNLCPSSRCSEHLIQSLRLKAHPTAQPVAEFQIMPFKADSIKYASK